jgi:hypothetical protein
MGAPPPPGGAPAGFERPRGRPSGDPDKDEARLRRQKERERLGKFVPPSARDHRFLLYERKKGKARGKLVTEVLLSDVEDVLGDEPAHSEILSFLATRLTEKGYNQGHFEAVVADRKRVPDRDYSAFPVVVGETEEGFDEDNSDDDEDTYMPPFPYVQQPMQQYPPPPPQDNMALTLVERLMDRLDRQPQQDSGTGLMQVLLQQQQQAAEERRREDERRREEERKAEERREEQRREEQRYREEQERKREEERRRSDHRWMEMMLGLGTTAIPAVAELFKPKSNEMLPFLVDVIKSHNARDNSTTALEVMQQSAKEQVSLQGEMMRSMVASQSEAQSGVLKAILPLMAQTFQDLSTVKEEEGDTISRVLKFANKMQPMLERMLKPQATPMPQTPALALPHQQQTQSAEETESEGEGETEEAVTEDSQALISQVLYITKDLQQNAVGVDEAVPKVMEAANLIPQDMRPAIAVGDTQALLQAAWPVIEEDTVLRTWLTGSADVVPYLEFCLQAVQKIYRSEWSEKVPQTWLVDHIKHLLAQEKEPWVKDSAQQPHLENTLAALRGGPIKEQPQTTEDQAPADQPPAAQAPARKRKSPPPAPPEQDDEATQDQNQDQDQGQNQTAGSSQ